MGLLVLKMVVEYHRSQTMDYLRGLASKSASLDLLLGDQYGAWT
jgi:hypothetical protein